MIDFSCSYHNFYNYFIDNDKVPAELLKELGRDSLAKLTEPVNKRLSACDKDRSSEETGEEM